MDLLAMKEEARSFEEGGRFADAFALYRVILAHLEEKPPTRQVLPFYLKVGELAHRLGDTRTALTTYARGAERFSRRGDAQSVADLCLRILQTDPTRKDVHARFARRLLVHGHVEPARQLLLDYARRARSDSLHGMLVRMERWPDDEVRRLLTDFLDRVVPDDWKRLRAADPRSSTGSAVPRSAPTAPPPTPSPPPIPEQPEPRTSEPSGAGPPPPPRPVETKPPPPVVAATPPTPAVGASPPRTRQPTPTTPLPTRPAVRAQPPAATPTREPARPEPPAAEASGPARSQPPPYQRRSDIRRPAPPRRVAARPRRRRTGLGVAVSLLGLLGASVAVGYALAPRGILPFGIKGHTTDTARLDSPVVPAPIAAAAPLGPAVATDSAPTQPGLEAGSGAANPELEPGYTTAGGPQPVDAGRPETATLVPSEDRPNVPVAPAEDRPIDRAPPERDSGGPGADTAGFAQPGGQAAPADADTQAGDIWSAIPPGPQSPDRVVIVEDMPLLGVETFDAAAGVGIRLTQELPSGDTLSLTVVPLDSATAGQVAVGRVLIQETGSSAVGTTRFGRYLVTGRARMSASGMEYLLGRLVELVR